MSFFQLCWLVYQRYCFVSLRLSELISITSSIRHWRGCGIHYSSNDQTTDRRRRFLPSSIVFKTIWKPPFQSQIQFWALGAWSNWGSAHRQIPKHCSNEPLSALSLLHYPHNHQTCASRGQNYYFP